MISDSGFNFEELEKQRTAVTQKAMSTLYNRSRVQAINLRKSMHTTLKTIKDSYSSYYNSTKPSMNSK